MKGARVPGIILLAALAWGCGGEEDLIIDGGVIQTDLAPVPPSDVAYEPPPSELCPALEVDGIQGRTVAPSLTVQVHEVDVTLYQDGWDPINAVTSGIDGVFRFDGVADGHYTVQGRKSAFSSDHVSVDVVGGRSTWACVPVGI